MTDQPTLFDLPAPKRHDCVTDGPCQTCGATRPDDFARHMFLEPVSMECHECNGKTLHEMLFGPDREAALARHHRGVTRREKAKQ